MKMFFDTGASAVSISRATAIYLYDNDLISETDFVGMTKTSTADGAIADNMVIRLRDIELEGFHLKNIEAVVSSSLNAPLLLGQSAIQKLGKISLNGDILTIHTMQSQKMTTSQRDSLDARLKMLREERFTNDESPYLI